MTRRTIDVVFDVVGTKQEPKSFMRVDCGGVTVAVADESLISPLTLEHLDPTPPFVNKSNIPFAKLSTNHAFAGNENLLPNYAMSCQVPRSLKYTHLVRIILCVCEREIYYCYKF